MLCSFVNPRKALRLPGMVTEVNGTPVLSTKRSNISHMERGWLKMPLQRTPLYPMHLKYHGKMIDFGGWELPVEYEDTGIIAAPCQAACLKAGEICGLDRDSLVGLLV